MENTEKTEITNLHEIKKNDLYKFIFSNDDVFNMFIEKYTPKFDLDHIYKIITKEWISTDIVEKLLNLENLQRDNINELLYRYMIHNVNHKEEIIDILIKLGADINMHGGHIL